jgi:hypothetical protein
MKRTGSLFLSALLVMSGSAIGQEGAPILAGDKLRKAVSGKTVYLMTPIGSEIPIRYNPNGRITGSKGHRSVYRSK